MSEEINSSEGSRAERQRYPRLNTSVQLELIVEDTNAPIRTKTDEIAVRGCYLETMFTLPIGTDLTIILWLDDEKLFTKGRVVTRFPQVGNGIKFADRRAEDTARLTRFLAARQAQKQSSAE
jgi:PilZ domain